MWIRLFSIDWGHSNYVAEKVAMSDSQLCLIKYDLDSRFSVVVSLQKTSCALQENTKELLEFNTFNPRKTTISSTLLIR